MSLDRKYFRKAETASINPGFGTPWDASNPGVFYALTEDPTNSPLFTITSSISGIAGVKQVAAGGWVSTPLTVDKRLSGSFQFVARAYEGAATNDARLAIQILLISGDGTVVRGQLFYGRASTELPVTSLATQVISGTLTPLESFAGDRIAVVLGFDIENTGTGVLLNAVNVGDDGSSSDAPFTGGQTSAVRPWIEFNWDDPPNPPLNLGTSEVLPKKIVVGWDPPSSGVVPTGYDVRIDGRSPVTLGNLFEHSFTNVADGTEHLVEVRSRVGELYSPWVSIPVTTPALQVVVSWDNPDERLYQTGCDHGAIYFDDGSAVAWNGITGVDETGTGTSSVLYRDGEIYYSDVEPSDFTAQIKAYFWPDAFGKCLGIPEITEGLYVDNQKPRKFNFTYRNLVGSGGKGDRFGHQIHLVYNALAAIGTRSRRTRTQSVSLDEFTFDIVATPVKMPGLRPSAHYIIDTRTMDKTTVAQLESILYMEGRLPDPQELYDLMSFGDAIIFIDHGDGTWTARGSRDNIIDHGDGTWTIRNVNGTDHGDGTFTLEDTP